MHRSITFSEIFSSTFSNQYEANVDDGAKNIFIARIAIGVVEVSTFNFLDKRIYYIQVPPSTDM